MLGTSCSCTCHLFLTRWSLYSSACNNTLGLTLPILNGTTKYPSPIPLSCLLLGPTLWKLSGYVLSSVASFFGGSPTWTRVCLASSGHSFTYHTNTFLLMCRSRGKRLIINLSYHTCISFIFSPLPYNTRYLSWPTTSYGCPSFTMLVWSYHQQFRYAFFLVPLGEWTYSSPWYTLDTIVAIVLESGTHV
jgi:hypothetical protein